MAGANEKLQRPAPVINSPYYPLATLQAEHKPPFAWERLAQGGREKQVNWIGTLSPLPNLPNLPSPRCCTQISSVVPPPRCPSPSCPLPSRDIAAGPSAASSSRPSSTDLCCPAAPCDVVDATLWSSTTASPVRDIDFPRVHALPQHSPTLTAPTGASLAPKTPSPFSSRIGDVVFLLCWSLHRGTPQSPCSHRDGAATLPPFLCGAQR